MRVEEGGETALVKLGAAATSEDFRQWCLSKDGNALPVLVEITNVGWTQPMCHGAGSQHPMVSDMVTAIEFINAKGEVQVIDDPMQLRVAAGSLGLIGVILSQTFRLSKLQIAEMHPKDVPTPLAIPPPSRDRVPEQKDFDVAKYTDEELYDAKQKMVKEFSKFYVNYYWFAFQPNCWVHNWDAKPFNPAVDVRPEYPDAKQVWWQRTQLNISEVLQKTVLNLLPPVKIARLFGISGMALQPNDEIILASCPDAYHFRRGIHQKKVRDFEVNISIPKNAYGEYEWEIVQQAWWTAIRWCISACF